MIYTSLQNVLLERTIKPLYAKTQATAQDWTVDPTILTNATIVKPGFIAAADTVDGHPVATLAGTTDAPIGFFANFINGVEDEVAISGTDKVAIWTLDNDARFFIDKSVLATSYTPTLGDLIGADASGMATKVTASAKAVAKVYDITTSGIVVEGLDLTDYANV